MSNDQPILIPSGPLPAARSGVLTPFHEERRVLPVGHRAAPAFRELPVEVVLDKDVPVELRDGVTIRADIFRPVTDEKVPVIVAWSPYGKGQGTSPSVMGIFAMVGLENGIVSGLEKFEGPDPAYWCAHGYAVCHPDPRGIVDSEGDSLLWDRQEGRDCYDLVEWLATQDWCSGKVGMSGTSYLAASQWFTAAERPPHLAAINPWEGVSDVYRDLVMRGGMPDTGFARQLQEGSFFGRSRKEDVLAEVEAHPLRSEFWGRKAADLERIEVPAYVVASYSNTLHTAGTFRGWRSIGSEQKWLRIHDSQEWPDYYAPENVEDLRRFFDHFLLGVENDWLDTPRVRYSLLDLEGGNRTGIPADSFPPRDAVSTPFYLDAAARELRRSAPEQPSEATYDTATSPAAASFLTRFEEETSLVGYPKARLWVEVRGGDDMELFVLLQKLDAHGTPLQEFTVPNHSARIHDVTDHGATILRYQGSDGRLRVSARHLDPDRSAENIPVHTFDRVEKLSEGEIVEVEIELLPLGLTFHAGEQLRVLISSRNLLGTMMPGIQEYVPRNSGTHVIHTGGDHPSHMLLPVLPRSPRTPTVRPLGEHDDAAIDAYELSTARRALALLKSRIGRTELLDLLAEDIRRGDDFLRSGTQTSGGEQLEGSVTLEAAGISAHEFTSWLSGAFAREEVMLAGHPEHYVIHAENGTVNIVETLGEHVCSFFMKEWDEGLLHPDALPAPSAPVPPGRRSFLTLADGTVVGIIGNHFEDTAEGLTAHLSVALPRACGEAVVQQHLEHFSVEFRTWILRAAREIHGAS